MAAIEVVRGLEYASQFLWLLLSGDNAGISHFTCDFFVLSWHSYIRSILWYILFFSNKY